MASNNVLSADNQQERLQLPDPWYITGLVDGEGSFHIAIYQDQRMKTGLKIIPEFHVSQNAASEHVLRELKTYFACGYTKVNHRSRQSDQTMVYVVRDRNALLTKIIPFFEQYPLRTTKANDFSHFARIVRFMSEGQHRTKQGIIEIIVAAYSMNQNAKRRRAQQNDLIAIVESSETTRGTPT